MSTLLQQTHVNNVEDHCVNDANDDIFTHTHAIVIEGVCMYGG